MTRFYLSLCLMILTQCFYMTVPVDAQPKKLDVSQFDFVKGATLPKDAPHDWNLGPTGARGWIFSDKGHTGESRQILITSVTKDSPSFGVLEVGDVIVGIGTKDFSYDARIEIAKAITAAEEPKSKGSLKLKRWRSGKIQTVEIKLQVMGVYSDTAPFDCPKSAKVFDVACAAIAKKGLKNVGIDNNMNALALLASGNKEYLPMLAEYAKKVSEFKAESFATWSYGYCNMFLAEYYMATGDKAVFEGMKRLALEAARGQSLVGTWGHKFAKPSGGLYGYGCMNQPGLSLTISMVLAREAGVREPELDIAIDKAAKFLRWYVNKGAVPYGDHGPFNAHEDNGKCSSATVLFDLLGDQEAADFFAKMSIAAYNEREGGHTGNYFNVLWALPGVVRGGPIAAGAYMKEQSWYYDLARDWEGNVVYLGAPVGGEEVGAYKNWSCNGTMLLAYAVSRKNLMLLNKKPSVVTPFDKVKTAEVIAAGRDFFEVDGKSPYELRSDEKLLAGLSSWSPEVRRRSANALGAKKANVAPEVIKLLSSKNPDARYGACVALAQLGPAADPAAKQLTKLLQDSDPWLQSLAAMVLPTLSPEVRKASVSDLLAMSIKENPSDPRRTTQRYASAALFSPFPGARGPRSILIDSIEGVDREKLYPAIKSILDNEDPVARGAVSRIYPKLTDEDLVNLLPDILEAAENVAPSNEMFADGVRMAGIDLLSKLHIQQGMELCVVLIEPTRWGGGRVVKCTECLTRYGTHANAMIPKLIEVRDEIDRIKHGNKVPPELQIIDDCIAKIKASKETPTLVDIKDFKKTTKAPIKAKAR